MAEDQKSIAVFPEEFWTDHKQEDTGELIPVDYVRLVKKGNISQALVDSIPRLKKHKPHIYEVIKPRYDAWKKGENVEDGKTSLSVVAFLTKQQVNRLRGMAIYSVEDLAELSDSDINRYGMGGLDIRAKARVYVEARKDEVKIAGIMSAKDEEIKSLKVTIETMMQALDEIKSEKKKNKKRDETEEAA